MDSKALEINLATSRVDVTVDERYDVLREVMEKFPGIQPRLQVFLEEICHPYRNWEFILKEALIHFLRKQSHVESSNQTIELMECAKSGDISKNHGYFG